MSAEYQRNKRVAIAQAYGHECEEWQLHWVNSLFQTCDGCGREWFTGCGRHFALTAQVADGKATIFPKIKMPPRVVITMLHTEPYEGRHREEIL